MEILVLDGKAIKGVVRRFSGQAGIGGLGGGDGSGAPGDVPGDIVNC